MSPAASTAESGTLAATVGSLRDPRESLNRSVAALPQGARQEIWALLCLYQALRTLITRAALITGPDATRIKFLPALDAVKDSVGRAFSPS